MTHDELLSSLRSNAAQEAHRIVDDFGSAIARASIYSKEALIAAADHIDGITFIHEEAESEVIKAFSAYLRYNATRGPND